MFNIIKRIVRLFTYKQKFSLEERRELANIQREAFKLVINNPHNYLYTRKSRDKSDFEKVVDNIEWLDSFLADNGVISEIDSLWPSIAKRKKQIRNLNDNLIRALICSGFEVIDAREIASSISKFDILKYSLDNGLKTVIEVITKQNDLFCEILEDPTLRLLDEIFLSVRENSLPIVKKTSIR